MWRILVIALVGIGLAQEAHAFSVCAGETRTGTIVQVRVNTIGSMGVVQGAQVTIQPRGQRARSYAIRAADIPQFYESERGNSSFVGLSAFVGTQAPVQIHYVGPNYQQDLIRVLRNPARRRVLGNEMRVWMGPGYRAGQTFLFRDVVCQVFLDP